MKKRLISLLTIAMLIVPTMTYAKGGFSSGSHSSFSSGSHSSFSSGSRSNSGSRSSLNLSKPRTSSSKSSSSSKSTVRSGSSKSSSSTVSSGRSGFSGGTSNTSSRRPYVSNGRTYMTTSSGRSVYVVNSPSSHGGFWSHAAAFGAGTFLGSMMHPSGYGYVPHGGGAPVYSGSSFLAGLLDFFLTCLVLIILVLIISKIFFGKRRSQSWR